MVLNLFVIVAIGIIVVFMSTVRMGFFSALLHFACVVAAGAIAFAFWEPVVLYLLGPRMPDYAWGVSLVILFAFALAILRLLMDKAVPHNVNIVHSVNFAGGAILGGASGILSVGIAVIGIQFMQMPASLMGYEGWHVDDTGTITRPAGMAGRLIIPVDEWTAWFYTQASLGSMWAPNPLAKWHPDLAQQANLKRHSLSEGMSRQGLVPNHVKINGLSWIDEFTDPARFLRDEARGIDPQVQAPGNRFHVYLIDLSIDNAAMDPGDRLRLTKGQVRLVVQQGSRYIPIHPHAFIQRYEPGSADEKRFRFDSNELAAVSVGGVTADVRMRFEFVVPANAVPHHLIVRQMRERIGANLTANRQRLTERELLAFNPDFPSPSPGMVEGRPWIGYLAAFGCAVLVMIGSLRESKRGHQD